MIYLGISRRAIRELAEINQWSTEQWGKRVARDYLASIEDALERVRTNPSLLRDKPKWSRAFCFYRVQRHQLVFAVFEDALFLLSVKHTSMDIPERLGELEPNLLAEARMLHRAYREKKVW